MTATLQPNPPPSRRRPRNRKYAGSRTRRRTRTMQRTGMRPRHVAQVSNRQGARNPDASGRSCTRVFS